MKKLVLVFILVTIPFLLFGQSAPQKDLQKESFYVESEEPFIFVSQEFKGAVSDVDQMMKEFMANFFEQQLIPSGQPMAFFYNAPRSSSDKEVRIEIGLPIPKRAEVKSPLKIQEMKLPPLMKYVHKGPYAELFDAYARLRGLSKNNGLEWSEKFVIHRFLNNPAYVRPEEIETEVLIPLAGNPILRARPSFEVGEPFDFRLIYKDYVGSVNQLGEFVNDFMKEFYARKLSPAGQPMVILSRAPRSQDDQKIRMRVGFPVGANFPSRGKYRIKSPLKIQQMRMGNIAKQQHMGPYEKLFDSFNQMLRSLESNRLRSRGSQVLLILENNPSLVRQEEIKAEIIIPVRKM